MMETRKNNKPESLCTRLIRRLPVDKFDGIIHLYTVMTTASMMKYLLAIAIAFPLLSKAQDTTGRFTVEGAISKGLTVGWAVLKTYKTVTLDSMTVYNHTMNRKGNMKRIKGVLLKDILHSVEFAESSPKKLSEFYLTCVAKDGYTVVFSWNEIFNSETGSHVMIIMEKDGSAATSQEDRIALISPTDIATGRRYVKGLSKIIISRVK